MDQLPVGSMEAAGCEKTPPMGMAPGRTIGGVAVGSVPFDVTGAVVVTGTVVVEGGGAVVAATGGEVVGAAAAGRPAAVTMCRRAAFGDVEADHMAAVRQRMIRVATQTQEVPRPGVTKPQRTRAPGLSTGSVLSGPVQP